MKIFEYSIRIFTLIGFLLLSSNLWALPSNKIAQVEIGRIEIEGVTAFQGQEIETAMEILVGDDLDHRKVVRSAENIQGIYRAKGYEQVRIRSELTKERGDRGAYEHVLKFYINEGLPTKISSIVLIPKNLVSGKNDLREYWTKKKPLLVDKLGMSSGDTLDQDKVRDARRIVQEQLAYEQFIGAKVEDVQFVQDSAPPALSTDKDKAAKWVKVELYIHLGERVNFGFRGNTVFTRAKLLGFIEEQASLGFGKNYVTSVQTKIEEAYKNIGYGMVRIRSFTFEKGTSDRHVTYEISEGPRLRIESIDFDGNMMFTTEKLIEEFNQRSSTVVYNGYYVEREIQKAAELTIEWMKTNGYLGAKLIGTSRTFTDKNRKVRILFYVYEGEQTVVDSVRLPGRSVFSDEEVRKIIGVRENRPLNLFALNEGLEHLKVMYRAKGYLEMKVGNEGTDSLVQYSNENRLADVFIEINEGHQYRVSRIEIDGLTKTKPLVVLRELLFKENDILQEPLIAESEARLRKTGVFSTVLIRSFEDAEKPGFRVVRISVQEGTPGLVGGGIGFRNDLGIRTFGQVAYTNIWHRNHAAAINGSVNQRLNENFCSNRGKRAKAIADKGGGKPDGDVRDRADCFTEYQVQLGYTWPWFALGETTFRPAFTVNKTQYLMFDTSSIAFDASIDRKLISSLNLSGALTYSLERTEGFGSPYKLDNQIISVGSITPSLTIDLRDNSLSPTSGFFSSTSYEYAAVALGSRRDPYPVGYTRWQYRADGYIPFRKNITWYLSFRTGLERNLVTPPPGAPEAIQVQYAIPMFKQFSLGGAGSLRGFSEQELNVQSMAVSGTCSYVNYRTQLDLPFAGALRFGPFLDAGNLLIDSYSFSKLRYGTGIGFHYQTPIGSVNFDWGFKIDHKLGEDPNFFYFSIGSF